MVKKYIIHAMFFIGILFLSFSVVHNPFSLNYIDSLKEESLMVVAPSNSLLQEIESKAESYNVAPIDARVDRVWKAVPGYNGLKVDVEASYDKMKKVGLFDENRLVFNEISPSIHLENLEPQPIYRGNEEKPMVSFLINVAWGNEYIPEILKTLNKHSIKSTFFLDGSWVKNNPQIALMIYEEGHEIGSHAYSHPDMNSLTQQRIDEELQKTNDVIEATLNVTPKWFAPPSGSFNQTVVDRAANLDMQTILWSVDTIDWRNPNPNEMSERVLGKVHNGAMILMHPTEASTKGLEQMIIGIKEKNYQIGTVTDLMDEKRLNIGVTLKQD
ncbi:hypothetical protein BALCAV_0205420 [Alkalihalobacillus alcalophilus ATCC 27647 = CGMCC 1.3604]|uniref:NodB homology domain-containing protein n=1 Tax=Alkalihalobacillus alcalophilus ATCC 27647 = CGMCC 1.3604 TaxID=1218173 RepID=A0A094WQA5_ALKAL|nr:polysaccharide deacetylase family protein [Alkalihalobacillus alcalophilus]KGA98203.1 hypothetical protein BALCAV_0205420 [Alkalihalobacillus alcalophilus ATCC 27647 = CGMCC 1.3604]MED1562142.1 polysaccharide deacetylase family protein [Alkalihalobacillus alcalophilus]